jgi:hypothetical protein
MSKIRSRIAALSGLVLMLVVLAIGQAAQHHIGETITLSPDLKLGVHAVGPEAFVKEHVTLTGTAKVFEVRFLKGAANPIVVLEPWKDSANSGVVLKVGDTLIAPTALIYSTKKSEDEETTTEVVKIKDLLPNKETGRGNWVGFSPKSMVLFLFDVPKELADKPPKLMLEVLIDFKRPPVSVEIVQ